MLGLIVPKDRRPEFADKASIGRRRSQESRRRKSPITLATTSIEAGVMELYNCKTTPEPNVYTITKFDGDLQVLSTYLVSKKTCACPRGTHSTCRHRQMLPSFTAKEHVDDGWFLDYHTRIWHAPVEPPAPDDDETAPPAESAESALPPAPAEAHHQPLNAGGVPTLKRRRIVQ